MSHGARHWPQALLFFYSALLVGLASAVLRTVLQPLTASLGITEYSVGLMIVLQALSFLVGLVVNPLLAQGVGTKRFALVATCVFSLVPLAGAFASSYAPMLVLAVVGGFAAGCVLSQGLDFFATVPPPGRRAGMLGLFVCCYFIGIHLGRIAAGMLVVYVNWHWAFLALVPLGLILAALQVRFLPHLRQGAISAG